MPAVATASSPFDPPTASIEAALNAIPGFVYSRAARGGGHLWSVKFSPSFNHLLDLPEGPITHDDFLGQVHPLDVERVSAVLRQAARNGESYGLDYRLLTADGQEVAVRDSAAPQSQGHGATVWHGVAVTLAEPQSPSGRDAARGGSENSLERESAGRLRELLANAPAEARADAQPTLFDIEFIRDPDLHWPASGGQAHAALVRALSHRLRRFAQPTGSVLQLRPYAFAIFDRLPAADVQPVTLSLAETLQGPFEIDGREVRLSGRVGVAQWPFQAATATDPIRGDDSLAALARAGAMGRLQFGAL